MWRNFDQGPTKGKRRKKHKSKGWKKAGRTERSMKKEIAKRDNHGNRRSGTSNEGSIQRDGGDRNKHQGTEDLTSRESRGAPR